MLFVAQIETNPLRLFLTLQAAMDDSSDTAPILSSTETAYATANQ
jgi:hypothetical protein